MSKSKKSSSEKEHKKLKKLMKKLKKINKKMDKYKNKEIVDSSSSSESEIYVEEKEAAPLEVEELEMHSNDPEKDPASQITGEKLSKSEEEIVDEEWLNIVGEDPTESSALHMEIKPDLLKRWNFFSTQGIKKEDFETLTKKYECFKEFGAPTLNPQISATMKDIARDNHMKDIQSLAGTALSVVGSLISSIYDNKDEGLDLESLLTSLCDTGKLLTSIILKQSNSRKAFIEPGLTKETRAILKDTKIDEFLYGQQLGEKIKEAKAINKLGENLKVQTVKTNPQISKKQPLNGKAPFARRPPMNQTGYTNFGGCPRPRVSFKNRQQFVNHRFQNPQRPRLPTPKQDKKE